VSGSRISIARHDVSSLMALPAPRLGLAPAGLQKIGLEPTRRRTLSEIQRTEGRIAEICQRRPVASTRPRRCVIASACDRQEWGEAGYRTSDAWCLGFAACYMHSTGSSYINASGRCHMPLIWSRRLLKDEDRLSLMPLLLPELWDTYLARR